MNRLIQPILLITGLVLSFHTFARDYSALVVEPESGRVLYEKYAHELRHPASITKMMTLYLVFEALERGEITLNTPLTVSRYAMLRPPSRLGLTAADSLSVEDAILALVTRSANDAASVIAENLGGSEPAFGDRMTAKARSLGMKDSVFRNASGLPDPEQVTTAWDMYRLGRALITDFPRYYPYFSTPRFYYQGRSFDNHNHLMETYPGMDGIKTGFINSSGFNLVASAKRNGKRLIGVVFGGPSAVRRDRHMRDILNDGFAQLEGAAPGLVVADFERAPEARRPRFDDGAGLDAPELSFASPRRARSLEQPVSSHRGGRSGRSPVRAATHPAPRGKQTASHAAIHGSSKQASAKASHAGPVTAKPKAKPSVASACKSGRDKKGKCLSH
jgi:D-alanyl-D-alanine carboxypeptidase